MAGKKIYVVKETYYDPDYDERFTNNVKAYADLDKAISVRNELAAAALIERDEYELASSYWIDEIEAEF